jgi:hypothetical protein
VNPTTETILDFYRAACDAANEGRYADALVLVGIARGYPAPSQPADGEIIHALTKRNAHELHQHVARVRAGFLAEWGEGC